MRTRSSMGGLAAAFGAAALAMFAPAASAEIVTRVCVLTGSQENPPTPSDAIGCGRFEIDTCANTLSYRIVVAGLMAAETAAHIHGFADPGTNAGILHPLPAGPVKAGVWTYAEDQEADILAGRIYVNVHSTMFPGGEARGQVVTHVALLDGAQENPPTPSPGEGVGLFMLDRENNELDYHIIFSDLGASETAAHIHGLALHGTNAGILHPLPAGSPKIGTWNYAEDQEQAIIDGLTYVNVHSTAFPGGEIRGQIVALVAPVDGGQEVPPNASPGVGCAMISLNRAIDTLGYDLTYFGLTTPETAAHIHGFAPPGMNAGILHPLPPGPRKLGQWSYGAANEAGLLDGRTYANVHTTMFPGGEIRGQLLFPRFDLPCYADFNCDGMLTPADFSAFRTAFLAGDMAADCDGSGSLTAADFSCFRAAFLAGCP